jgi:hypothetical protein
MITTVNFRSSAPIRLGQGSNAKSPGLLDRQKSTPPPQVSDSKMVRLKLTRLRAPRKYAHEVDWDEDLRPTPNEIVEARANREGTSFANTDPKISKTINKKTGNKRTKQSKPSTTSAKRRKSNPTRSTTAKQENARPPQLPLITLAASALAATLDKNEPSAPGPMNSPAVKNIVDLPEASRQTSPPKDDHKKIGETSPRVSVIRKGTSVMSDSSSNLDVGIQMASQSQKVSILEYRAQINGQQKNSQAIRMLSDASSSSEGDKKKSTRENASRITIYESRALKKQSAKTKNVREAGFPKNNGRAQSVGNKLVLALHRNEHAQREVVIEDAPIIISSDPVESEGSPQKRQSDLPSIKAAPKPVRTEQGPDKIVRIESRQHQIKSQTVKSPSTNVTDKINEAEAIDATGGMTTWGSFLESLGHSSRSSTQDSDIEIGRGLIDDGPSVLDHHMETEYLSGFAALHPIRSGPTTSSEVTKPCESRPPTSSETSIAGKTIDPAVVCIEKGDVSHTPESQKPLLPNETLKRFNSPSPQRPRSVPRTTIVDRNGSPRLMPQSNKSTVAPQLDLDGDPSYEDEPRITDTSPSQYDRSTSEPSTESEYQGVIWTKFQRDMFMAYGIETEKLTRPHPWPPLPKHEPSFSQEGTADGANSVKGSTIGPGSSERTLDERGLGAHNVGQFDRSIRTEISGSSQPDTKPHRSSDEDAMEWISTLQVAQKDAHNLLHETNSASRFIGFICIMC